MRKQISAAQKKFDSLHSNKFIINENVQGPLIINRSCTVSGNGFMIWAEHGPVLVIKSSGVRIENLRVYVKDQQSIAITTEFSDTVLSDVEINGTLKGFTHGSDIQFPSFVPLGKLNAGNINTYILELDLPSNAKLDAKLDTDVHGVNLSPGHLHAGHNEIRLEVGHVSSENFIYGSINIITGSVIHKLRLFGEANDNFPPVICRMRFNKGCWEEKQVVRSGERQEISISEKLFIIRLLYNTEDTKNRFVIDPCIFLLNKEKKARGDEDMFFFNNPGTPKSSVYIYDNNNKIFINLEKIEPDVDKIVLYYAIFSENPNENFHELNNPRIIISKDDKNDNECFYLPLIFAPTNTQIHRENNKAEYKTLHALEFYRTANNKWKIYFAGTCPLKSIKHICEDFGLTVIQD